MYCTIISYSTPEKYKISNESNAWLKFNWPVYYYICSKTDVFHITCSGVWDDSVLRGYLLYISLNLYGFMGRNVKWKAYICIALERSRAPAATMDVNKPWMTQREIWKTSTQTLSIPWLWTLGPQWLSAQGMLIVHFPELLWIYGQECEVECIHLYSNGKVLGSSSYHGFK